MAQRKTYVLFFAATFCLTLLLIASPAQPGYSQEMAAKIDPNILKSLISGSHVEFLVLLEEQADLSGAELLQTKEEKGQYVFEKLSETGLRTQGAVISALEQNGSIYRPYWIVNMILVRGGEKLLSELASRHDVGHIFANPEVTLDVPRDGSQLHAGAGSMEWNIKAVGADVAWSQGVTGQGVVIGGQDTGYEWHHPALINQYRGWDGASVDHNYNWHDTIHSSTNAICAPDSQEACDDNGHGTHTMGIAVGDDGIDHQIGVAPEARWIGCRNMDRGVGTPATYAECYQWFLAPTDLNDANPDPSKAPDIITNSWSCPPTEGCTDPLVLKLVVENIRAAGILPVHSAGNSGPECFTISTPAAIYDASFTVGATNELGEISSFSSRGPVKVDGSFRLKPDLSAPGSGVLSSVLNGGYASKSGTSMAAPHVAGMAALAISDNPYLKGKPENIEELLKSSAAPVQADQSCGEIPGDQVPNNTYGFGIIQFSKQEIAFDYQYFAPIVRSP